jgi:hypothetical protein
VSEQSRAAAERSAHVTRGPEAAAVVSPVVEVRPGVCQLRAVVERDAEIERLRAQIGAMRSPGPVMQMLGNSGIPGRRILTVPTADVDTRPPPAGWSDLGNAR